MDTTTEKVEQTLEPETDGERGSLLRKPLVIGGEMLAVAGGLYAAKRVRDHRAAQRRAHRLRVPFR